MKSCFLIILLAITLHQALYSQTENYGNPIQMPLAIVKDLMNWLTYERDHMVWSGDYISLDIASKQIPKKEFLKRLMTGNYLPVKIKTADLSLCYQLYRLEDSVDSDIKMTIKNKAVTEYQHYKMEGMLLPGINFVDLNNNIYDFNNTKDKILVLNCWFIHCTPCVSEIPELNKLVSKFKKRTDILFLGLAFDPSEDLRNFLKQVSFKYKIIPDKTDYLMKELKISQYPTHLIIDKKGVIVKVSSNLNEIIFWLDRLAAN